MTWKPKQAVLPQLRVGGYGPYFDEMERLSQWPGVPPEWAKRKLEGDQDELSQERATVRPSQAGQRATQNGPDSRPPWEE